MSTALSDESWTKVITSRRGWLDIDLRAVWRYRDLVYLFVRRDLTATYKQTILGPAWFFIQPLFTSSVFTIIFGRVANLSTDAVPPFLFYLAGVTAWNYFGDCLAKTSNTFTSNSGIFSKIYFPRLIMPLATTTSNLISFALQFALFLGVYFYMLSQGAPLQPSFRVIVLPFLILQMAALGIGVGCLVSALTTRYRDLAMAVGFGVQLWMYGSCVFYPLSSVPERWQWIFMLNPMVPVIESFRFAFLGAGTVEIWQLALGALESFVIFLVGIAVFNHVEKSFSDTI